MPPASLRPRLLPVIPLAMLASTAASAQDPDPVVLGTIEVEAESDQGLVQDGYVPISGRIGSKAETPFVEVPQSVSVITERQLDDRNPATLEEALGYVPGVRIGAYGLDPRYDAFWIRGFDATYNGIFQDNLRRFAAPTGIFRSEPYGLEAVEILKGPSSSLYGASTAGGLVNLVTKKPTEQPFRELELQVGSHERKQANLDLSGPANEKGTLLYRLTGVLRDSETEIDDYPDNRAYIAPAVTWKPSEDTTLTILGEYMDSKVGSTAHYVGGPDPESVTDEPEADPNFNDFTQEQYRIGYEFSHRFNDTFSFFSAARYAGLKNDQKYSARAYHGYYQSQLDTVATDNFLQANYDTGPVRHLSILGFAYSWADYEEDGIQVNTPWQGRTPDPVFVEHQKQHLYGLYAAHRIDYENWILNLGGRYDWLRAETTTPGVGGRTTTDQDEEEFSWRAALSYRTDWGLVPYVSYSTSFTPNIGTVVDGTPAKPTVADQKELGIKYELPDYNAFVTASLFEIEQKDGVVFDASSGVNEQVQEDLTSRGFEIEAVASLDNGLSFVGSYTYTDVEIDKGAQGTEGNTLNAIPRHSFSVYADYTIQAGTFRGLGAGAGVRYTGQSYGDDQNEITNDSRYFIDGAVHYELGNLAPALEGARFQVNGYNLLDKQSGLCASGYCGYRDEGRKVIASLRYRF